jgi:predicted ATPase
LAAMLCMFLRDPAGVEEHTNASITIATEYAIPFTLSLASIMRGWALGMQGRRGQGVAEMREAIASAKEAGYAQRPRWFPFIAELEATSKGPEAGLKTLSDGFALLEITEERFYEAELHRVKGELLLMQSDSNAVQAESCFEDALEVARKQGAKSLELRATMSLARLLAKQGKHYEAGTTLSEIYGWFTEGFNTADLKEAKTLLEEFAK